VALAWARLTFEIMLSSDNAETSTSQYPLFLIALAMAIARSPRSPDQLPLS
jgi:hypothetical protein